MTGPKYETYEGPNNFKATDMPPPEFMRQVAEMRNAFDYKNINTTDTSSIYMPQLSFYDSGRPVDSLQTNAGRTFQFDKDGNARYKVTSKDYRGLNDVVKDYMTTRDGKTPTPDQIRKMVDRVAKDPANGIRDVNNIRPGQNLRFPGPEQAMRIPDTRVPAQPPMDWRYAMPPERPDMLPPGWEHTRPGLRPPEKEPSSPHIQPPGSEHGTNKDVLNRKVTDTQKDQHGNRVTKYEGELRDGVLGGLLSKSILDIGQGRTQFNAEDKTDSQGRLLERKITYSNQKWGSEGGIEMKIIDPKGGELKVEVKQVEVKYNPTTGNYDTTLIGPKGQRIQVETDRNGKQVMR